MAVGTWARGRVENREFTELWKKQRETAWKLKLSKPAPVMGFFLQSHASWRFHDPRKTVPPILDSESLNLYQRVNFISIKFTLGFYVVLVSFPVAPKNGRSTLRRKGHTVGTSAGHSAFGREARVGACFSSSHWIPRKEEGAMHGSDQLTSFSAAWDFLPREWSHPHLRQVFSPQLTRSR